MSAVFSPCRTWRYTLTRDTGVTRMDHPLGQSAFKTVAFIGLNPSTADETQDDPTVRRCVGFAQRWGYERLVMLNIFGLRSTDPKALVGNIAPIGPQTDYYLERETEHADLVVCAWGNYGSLIPRLSRKPRGPEVRRLLSEQGRVLHVLGLTKDGNPRHPLYMRGTTQPVVWP